MTILIWDKPEKAISAEEWKSIGADGAPPGVYTPNMSHEDSMRWRAKLVGVKGGNPQVEIRKRGRVTGALALIIVSLGNGITKPGSGSSDGKERFRRHTQEQKVIVAISFNGTFCMDLQDYTDMNDAIIEAARHLSSL